MTQRPSWIVDYNTPVGQRVELDPAVIQRRKEILTELRQIAAQYKIEIWP